MDHLNPTCPSVAGLKPRAASKNRSAGYVRDRWRAALAPCAGKLSRQDIDNPLNTLPPGGRESVDLSPAYPYNACTARAL
jgi:hypothetical protein